MTNTFRLPEPWEQRAQASVPLRDVTTFRIGGPAARFITLSDPKELSRLVADLHVERIPWRLLGHGSNVLISDEGLNCLVIVFRDEDVRARIEGDLLVVSGSSGLHGLVVKSLKLGFTGLEFAAGIPGTVGGAVCGNAGAYGEQIGDRLAWVDVLSQDGGLRRIKHDELGFAYRRSRLQQSRDIVLCAALQLPRGNLESACNRVNEILAERKVKHPDWRETPCAGSFFRNFEPSSAADRRQSAGTLLDQVGAKLLHVGGAAVYPKHANILINKNAATCSEVLTLARILRQRLIDRGGPALFREVQVWPESLAEGLP